MSKLKNREGQEKKKGKGGKRRRKEKSNKTHVKIPLKSLNDRKKSTKQGRILEGGDFSGWPEYIPLGFLFMGARLQIL